MTKQLNVFIENKPGRLSAVTKILKENNINIMAVSIQDRGNFGLIKLIVSNPDMAHIIISENGFACATKEIIAIEVDDKPGSLFEVLSFFEEKKINIQDAYGYVVDKDKKAVFCIEVEDRSKVESILKESGIKIIGTLYKV